MAIQTPADGKKGGGKRYESPFQGMGGSVVIAAGIIGAALVISALLLPSAPQKRAPDSTGAGTTGISPEAAKEQFIREVKRQSKSFRLDAEKVRNVRVTHNGKLVVLDFDYVLEGQENSQTRFNFKMEKSNDGSYRGTIKVGKDSFYVYVY